MLTIGKMTQLEVLKHVDFGVYLDGGEVGEILLPLSNLPKDYDLTSDVGAKIDVCVYFDSEDRLVATAEVPFIQVDQIATLKVVAVEAVGAFLDWGLLKDLFLPHAEQTLNLRVGDEVVVICYLDNTDRVAASMRLEKRLKKTKPNYEPEQEVQLQILSRTDLGYSALINESHIGMLYENEVFQTLKYAQKINGFVRRIRDDGKIDLNLKSTGHKAADDIGPKILELLKEKNGFLPLNEKTPPEKIYTLFGASKKKYKIALGGLYKKRLITVDEDGIRLVPEKPAVPAKKS